MGRADKTIFRLPYRFKLLSWQSPPSLERRRLADILVKQPYFVVAIWRRAAAAPF
ncbi:hypothetical protein [Kingella oralis]|uniref:Uncharacterized protein n=1 Tax=Kingella oralis ATCC 51147 TaxID=629741 RepID=C4GJ46_9NEIS|nr:hypothetical protein [Kingella oralis]EEP67818.1 hypothetical protein GCWU000324_02068 [Kingella oralis ATCC 51147]QMT43357.1 hypothetical protein H3L93_03180 [Kingella oralis]